jgi:hypothetical protein
MDSASGRYASPVSMGLYPRTCCMYRVMKKNIENSEAPIRRPTAFAPVNVRRRKMRKGTSGASERSSIATNAASSSAATPTRPRVCADPQPASAASTIA